MSQTKPEKDSSKSCVFLTKAVKEIPHTGTADEDFELELKALSADPCGAQTPWCATCRPCRHWTIPTSLRPPVAFLRF